MGRVKKLEQVITPATVRMDSSLISLERVCRDTANVSLSWNHVSQVEPPSMKAPQ